MVYISQQIANGNGPFGGFPVLGTMADVLTRIAYSEKQIYKISNATVIPAVNNIMITIHNKTFHNGSCHRTFFCRKFNM